MPHLAKIRITLAAIFLLAALAGCKTAAPVAPTHTAAPTTPAATATPAQPTATPLPLAAKVNNEGILQADFDAELQRYQAANPNSTLSPADQRKTVLEDLIDQTLLAQAAAEGGYKVDDAALKDRLTKLAEQAGGVPAFQDWMKRNGYTDESFARSLRLSILAAWERDKVIAAVPQTAEQVHARQILVQDETLANSIESQLKNGADFATLALQYDPVTGGELGWFPRGYLTQPEVDDAAFQLQPNAYSAVIKSAIGYHIIQVIERDAQRALEPGARRALQEKALQDWIQQHRAQAKIDVLLK